MKATNDESITSEEFVLSTATIEDDFADNRILVLLSNEASKRRSAYSDADFSEIGYVKVDNITAEMYDYLEQKQATTQKSLSNYTENYKHVPCIELATPGKQNVLDAIKALRGRDDILYVGPDYVIQTQAMPGGEHVDEQWAHGQKMRLKPKMDVIIRYLTPSAKERYDEGWIFMIYTRKPIHIRKLILLLVIIAAITSVFAACQTVPESSYEPLTEDKIKAIRAAWEANPMKGFNRDEHYRWDLTSADCYYGTHGDCIVIFETFETIFNERGNVPMPPLNIRFISPDYARIFVYRNGEFVYIGQAYENGWLTKEQIMSIAEHHTTIAGRSCEEIK